MNRTAVGLIALLLIVIGGITLVTRGAGDESTTPFAAGCIRVGLVLGALWLALPQITAFFARAPRWLLVASAIGLIIGAVKPWLLLIIVPVLIALWILGPKLATQADKPIVPQKRPRRRSSSK
jgi:hypothetical protein